MNKIIVTTLLISIAKIKIRTIMLSKKKGYDIGMIFWKKNICYLKRQKTRGLCSWFYKIGGADGT